MALISETHLKAANNANIANYTVYRTDRKSAIKGLTAIYIKRNIVHNELPPVDTNSLELTGIEVITKNGKINIYAAYFPPTATILVEDLQALLNTNQPTIIGGDLNSKHKNWNSRINNHIDILLNDYYVMNI